MDFFKDKEDPKIVELDDDALEAVTGGVGSCQTYLEATVEEVDFHLGQSTH